MSIKSTIALPYAKYISNLIKKEMRQAIAHQDQIMHSLISQATNTFFGIQHHFHQIHSHKDFAQAVPIRDYEEMQNYISDIKEGKKNVLWKGQPLYLAKTSGTTSGVKYIPISNESIGYHIRAARNALLCYIAETKNHKFVNGKMIFLSGSPELDKIHGIYTGRLSGIVNHHVPAYLTSNRLPSYKTNCIEDWETKLEAIVNETAEADMRLISGIPPWMQMYFDKLLEQKGKRIGDLFPNFSVLVHGGVNFEPYKSKLFETIGRRIDTIETFPASEGFFAFQDSQQHEGLLLNTNAGMFFEFVPAQEIFNKEAPRFTLRDVQMGVNYALIVSSNAGLWAYNIGDTIKFVSIDPYRIVVTGRIKHFISAFGEHVIAEEVEQSMKVVCEQFQIRTIEFTVAPNISSNENSSFHEWFIEFESLPNDIDQFALALDQQLRNRNIYYDDLVKGQILAPLKITILQKNAFINYMKSVGKLGGQNKVPRLSNDRKIADALLMYKVK